ncbi:MAG: MFS transporter [Micropruina sp.]|nr:MAG: MFS transporter [Micropruina sp.]
MTGASTSAATGRRSAGDRLAFTAATLALVVTFATSAAPVPLFNSYRSGFGFTNADISLAVVAYFAGTIGSLLLLGRLASHVGRRPASLASLALLAVGCLVLLNVIGLASLLAGRFLMGIGAGLASSSITAYIVDAAPASPLWLASVASSQAPNLGLAIGAIGSGGLVELGPWPTRLVYLAALVLLAISATLIALSAETVSPNPGAWRSLRPRVHLPARALPLLPVAASVFIATWAMGAFYQAFVPALVADQLHTSSALVFGLVFCSYMAPNVLGAPISGRFSVAGAQRLGMGIFLTGAAGLLTGVLTDSLPVFIVASVIAGTGQGVAMSGSVRGLLHGSDPSERAPIFAAIFLISYSGAAGASFVAGQLSGFLTLVQLVSGYVGLALLATLVVIPLARNPQPSRTGVRDGED